MKLMEWNIHGMAGFGNYSIPVHLIMDTILEINPEVIVLLEFVEYSNGFADLKLGLEKNNYRVHTTKPNRFNGVLVAVKSMYESVIIDEDCEYLEVKVTVSSEKKQKSFSIVGTRILSQGDYARFSKRKELLDSIIEKQKNKDFIMLLDANNGNIQYESNKYFEYPSDSERSEYNYQQIWREIEDEEKWSLITPDQGGPYNGGKYSIVTCDDHKKMLYHTKEDHIISSFSKDRFSEVDYYWKFVKPANGYGTRKPTDYLSDLIGLPDHGCLVASFEAWTDKTDS